MSITYTDLKGKRYFLDDTVTNSPFEMEHFDRIYSHKALELMQKTGKNIFYCLKMIEKEHYLQANYFLIPIEDEEKELVIKMYGDKFYIGIIHKY